MGILQVSLPGFLHMDSYIWLHTVCWKITNQTTLCCFLAVKKYCFLYPEWTSTTTDGCVCVCLYVSVCLEATWKRVPTKLQSKSKSGYLFYWNINFASKVWDERKLKLFFDLQHFLGGKENQRIIFNKLHHTILHLSPIS